MYVYRIDVHQTVHYIYVYLTNNLYAFTNFRRDLCDTL